MKAIKFIFDAADSHYVYKGTRPIAYVNAFKQVEDGNFTKDEAIKYVGDCNKGRASNELSELKNLVLFIYEVK